MVELLLAASGLACSAQAESSPRPSPLPPKIQPHHWLVVQDDVDALRYEALQHKQQPVKVAALRQVLVAVPRAPLLLRRHVARQRLANVLLHHVRADEAALQHVNRDGCALLVQVSGAHVQIAPGEGQPDRVVAQQADLVSDERKVGGRLCAAHPQAVHHPHANVEAEPVESAHKHLLAVCGVGDAVARRGKGGRGRPTWRRGKADVECAAERIGLCQLPPTAR